MVVFCSYRDVGFEVDIFGGDNVGEVFGYFVVEDSSYNNLIGCVSNNGVGIGNGDFGYFVVYGVVGGVFDGVGEVVFEGGQF